LAERTLAIRHFEKHGSSGPDVATRVGALTSQLFGRHIREGAGHFLRFRQRGGHAQFTGMGLELRQTEVKDVEATIRRQTQVAGL
jgi:hypothetical protein